jgi:uncharacterized membrane protein YebE (DUF533 family)
MDESLLFGSVLRGLLGVRPKRSMRALRYITGTRGGLFGNPATLLTAAGLAWGVFDTLRQGTAAQGTQGGQFSPATAAPTAPGSAGSPVGSSDQTVVPPPIPGTPAASSQAVAPDVLRMIRLAISAAYADGVLNDHERAAIATQAQAAGAAEIVERELQAPQPLKDIVAGVTDPAQRATLYVLAFTILRADEQVSGAERIYLAQLANLLGLDPDTVASLEKDTGDRIDALGDQGQLGG